MEGLAYFDNAATTFPKPAVVYDRADAFYRSSGGNIGRGGNAIAARAGKAARRAKANLLSLYRCEAKVIAFTASATDALNRILLGLDISEGDDLWVSPFEHNAVTRPLRHLERATGVNIRVLPFDKRALLPDMGAICEAFEHTRPRLVVLTHASNVCGAVLPVMEIFEVAKAHGATTVVDMSQTCGLLDLELGSELVDFAVFAGHKTLYSPFGVGGIICTRGTRLEPVLFGGNGIDSVDQDMPEDVVPMIEVGSQNTYAIAGLEASTDWIIEKGMEALRLREHEASERLLGVLRRYANLHLVADDMRCERIGVASATFDGLAPDEVEMLLGRYGVSVRSGIHCAPYAHRFLGTLPRGTVRFSVGALTTEGDFEALQGALDAIRDL